MSDDGASFAAEDTTVAGKKYLEHVPSYGDPGNDIISEKSAQAARDIGHATYLENVRPEHARSLHFEPEEHQVRDCSIGYCGQYATVSASAFDPRNRPGDLVNHPAHYGGDTTYETIKVIEAWNLGFNLGSALKYISRADAKGNPIQDLEKAVWYLQREIGRRQA